MDMLPESMHPLAPLLHYAVIHGVPITLLKGMDKKEREAELYYRTHASATKEVEFIHADLVDRFQAGHRSILLLTAVNILSNLWISPVEVNNQVGRRP